MKRIAYVGIELGLSFGLFVLVAGAQAQDQPGPESASKTQSQSQNASQSQAAPKGQVQITPDSSLGNYARKVGKGTSDGKPKPRVYDNDNIPHGDQLSIIGPSAKPESATENQQESDNGAEKSFDDKEKEKQAVWKGWQDKITGQQKQIELLQREFDVLQREYQIRTAEFFADAGNRLRNQAAWDQQDQKYKEQIGEKQKAIEEAKQKLSEMEEEARKAGVPSSMTEPAQQ